MDVLRLATRGGARLLGRDDIGSLEPGKAADFVLWDLEDVAYAGADDPVAALVFCNARTRAHTVVVHGQVLVSEGRLVRLDERDLVRAQNAEARKLLAAARSKEGARS